MCVYTNGSTGKHFLGDWYHCNRLYFRFNNCPVECGAWPVSEWPADQSQAIGIDFLKPLLGICPVSH